MSKREFQGSTWETEDEIKWLRGIGEWCQRKLIRDDESHGQMKRRLLLNYLAAAARRVRWGRVDPEVATAEAQRLLTEAAA